MAVVSRISEQEYRELVLHEEDRLWELWDGVPREKSPMSMMHEDIVPYLVTISSINLTGGCIA